MHAETLRSIILGADSMKKSWPGNWDVYQEKSQLSIIETFTCKESGWPFWDKLLIQVKTASN